MRYLVFIFLYISVCLQAQAPYGQIKGVWLATQDSALDSSVKIQQVVSNCKKAGINNIYVSVWNQGYTHYPSAVMMERFGVAIHPRFGQRDPLKELIEEAQAKKIKVHAWFEAGYTEVSVDSGLSLLRKYPYYAAVGTNRQRVEENGLAWMNPFHPLVQNFIKSLILEVVKKYNLDGVQYGQYLPAAPLTAGYDLYTLNEYKKEHNGRFPPGNSQDSLWLRWRSSKLSQFAKSLHQAIKTSKPDIAISAAPAVFPLASSGYLQDWPNWLKDGYVDYVVVQLYRDNLDEYQQILGTAIQQAGAKKDLLCASLKPLNGAHLSTSSLKEMRKLNTNNGLLGDVIFYHLEPSSSKSSKKK